MDLERACLSNDLQAISSRLLSWKLEYKNIYYVKLKDQEYIFRLLTKGEFLSLYFLQSQISNDAEEILLDRCILYPDQRKDNFFDCLWAGEVHYLIQTILSLSGFADFDNIKSDLDKERAKIQLLDNQIILLICKAFPHIKPSVIDTFDYPTILHHVALAEKLLNTELEITKQEDKKTINFQEENIKQGFEHPGLKEARPKRPRR